MNGYITSCVLRAIPLLMVVLGGSAAALDRRFELDLRILEQKIVPAAKAERLPFSPHPPDRSEARLRRSPEMNRSHPRGRETLRGGGTRGGGVVKIAPTSGREEMASLSVLWDKLVPGVQVGRELTLGADNFSLTLGSGAYQIIPAADGGRIVIDVNRTIPPLVRALIQEKEPAVRIVTGTPEGGTFFFSQLLHAAGFYSVEPDFTLDFGEDPRLSVSAEYRIERTAESLARNETILLYTRRGRYAIPPTLREFLGAAGFRVIEPDLPQDDFLPLRDRFIQVSGASRLQVADTILGAVGVVTETAKAIEFPEWVSQGITLKVRVDRFFIHTGKSYALAAYDGNPVGYTLTRLLESKGVSVVLLSPEDDPCTVIGKLLAALKLTATFEPRSLWSQRETPYTVKMSGYLLRNPASGQTTFLTDRKVSPLMLDLISRNGYAVTGIQP